MASSHSNVCGAASPIGRNNTSSIGATKPPARNVSSTGVACGFCPDSATSKMRSAWRKQRKDQVSVPLSATYITKRCWCSRLASQAQSATSASLPSWGVCEKPAPNTLSICAALTKRVSGQPLMCPVSASASNIAGMPRIAGTTASVPPSAFACFWRGLSASRPREIISRDSATSVSGWLRINAIKALAGKFKSRQSR